MDEDGKKADSIIFTYLRPNLTAEELFKSIPKKILLTLISFLEKVKSRGVIEPNVCNACKHLHNNGIWDYKRRMLMLDRAKQTLNGIWKRKD